VTDTREKRLADIIKEYVAREFSKLVKRLRKLERAIDDSQIKVCGPYKAGTVYSRNNVVMRDGASFICVADQATIDPREKTESPIWRLHAQRGQPGPQGEKGEPGENGAAGPKGDKGEPGERGAKGERGSRGAPGKDGKDGNGIKAVHVSGLNLAFVMADGKTHHVSLKEGVEQLIKKAAD